MQRLARASAVSAWVALGACAACADGSPLAGRGGTAEDARLLELAAAFEADDCARVEALAAGFHASTDLRLHAVTTMYGRCLFAREDDAGAVTLLARVAYAEPSDAWVPTALYWLGRARLRSDDAATAAADFGRFIERFGHHDQRDDATYHRAKAWLAAGDADAALADFEAVLALPDASVLRRAGATYGMGRALVERAAGDPGAPEVELAIGWYQRVADDFAASIYVDNAGWHRGELYYAQARYAEAIDAWAAVIATPGSVFGDNALYYTGRAWYRLAWAGDAARYPTAIALFERVLAEHGDSIYADNAAYFAARAHYQLGDLAAAEGAFARVPARWPASPYVDNAWSYLVRVRLARGDCAGAADALASLSLIDPPSGYLAPTRAAFDASPCAVTP